MKKLARCSARKVPVSVLLTYGQGVGDTPLNAFDAALVDAGIGDLNLVRVSSVLPPNARLYSLQEVGFARLLQPGQVVPAVYTKTVSSTPGEIISCAVAVIRPKNDNQSGMIFESAGQTNEQTIREIVSSMAIESMKLRQREWKDILIVSSSICVQEKTGCVVAAALLLDELVE